MDTGLKGKTVLITGASRNIGRIAALAFAREGANLAICTRSKMEQLNEVKEEARAAGAGVVAAQCDVSDAAMLAGCGTGSWDRQSVRHERPVVSTLFQRR